MKQIEKPYRSTEVFVEWLEKIGVFENKKTYTVCDMACGMGANVFYLAKKIS